MLFLSRWKCVAFQGAAAATFLGTCLSPAAALDGNYFKYESWDGRSVAHWQHRWNFSAREHRRRKHSPRHESAIDKRKISGPLLIVVSVAQQKATVFAGNNEIASTRVSTGVPGHPTPLGVFSVIQKQVYHESNLYSAAPMPYMQRITWSGIALHAGVVPGHPASHGCIRLPHDFAVRLYSLTKVGVRVVVTADDPAPTAIEHHTLFQPNPPAEKPVESVAKPELIATANTSPAGPDHTEITGSTASDAVAPAAKPPELAVKMARQNGALSVFISRKEGKLYARYKFATLFEMPVTISEPERPIGTHVFTAVEAADEGHALRWNVLTIPSVTSEKKHARERRSRERHVAPATLPSASEALDRVNIPDDVRTRVADLLGPGASLIVSDNGLSDETDSDTDLVVLTP